MAASFADIALPLQYHNTVGHLPPIKKHKCQEEALPGALEGQCEVWKKTNWLVQVQFAGGMSR